MVNVQRKQSKTLLTKASGFLEGYSHTLNPYTGCAFACSYCYVRQMPVALFRSGGLGQLGRREGECAPRFWSKELAQSEAQRPVTIFMSSATDPYQPIEYKERITRSLLEVMSVQQPDFLFVQTRSPLVTRDADLLAAARRARPSQHDGRDGPRGCPPSVHPFRAADSGAARGSSRARRSRHPGAGHDSASAAKLGAVRRAAGGHRGSGVHRRLLHGRWQWRQAHGTHRRARDL